MVRPWSNLVQADGSEEAGHKRKPADMGWPPGSIKSADQNRLDDYVRILVKYGSASMTAIRKVAGNGSVENPAINAGQIDNPTTGVR